jgi:hypothetical protein
MSRRNSRRRQQAMNQWRRDLPWRMAGIFGSPVYVGDGAWYVPPDPQREREEWCRQLTARHQLAPGEVVMPAEVGRWDGMRVITEAAPIDPAAWEALRPPRNAM